MFASKTVRSFSVTLAAVVTTVMLLGIDGLAQGDAVAASTLAQGQPTTVVVPASRAGRG